MHRFCLLVVFCVALYGQSWAQEVEVRMAAEKPPHYVGVPTTIQLTALGLEEDPNPKCEIIDLPEGVRAVLSRTIPQRQSRTIIVNNRVREYRSVTYVFEYRITADTPGDFQIGPFKITQGNVTKNVEAIDMSFQDVPNTDDMSVKLLFPETAYPDQRVSVKIQWRFAGDIENLNKVTIYSGLFDRFRFAPDQEPRRGDSVLPIQTSEGEIGLLAEAKREKDGDKTFMVLTAERTLIPEKPGTHEIDAVSATIGLVTQWETQRGIGGFPSFFDDTPRRRPVKVERFRAEGESRTFTIKPFPIVNQPESFTGSVGKGFSLDVAADRTVVRVGDPIRLNITLRGDGNIEGASLPALSADGGLDSKRFRLPDGDVAGQLTDGAKEFVVSVRVQEEGVNEIPGIAYSWFDTDREEYMTTRSDPIALRVNPTQIVDANSVVSPNGKKQMQADKVAAPQSKAPKSYSLTGADLAIEPDPSKLLVGSGSLLNSSLAQALVYCLGAAVLAVAFIDRRSRSVDPGQRQQQNLVSRSLQKIREAKSMPPNQAANAIAGAMRHLIAELPDGDCDAARVVLAECEELVFRPSGADNIDANLFQRAEDAVNGMTARGAAT